MSSNNLGIWENESCVQCGACCYEYNKNHLCYNQEIINGKSHCKAHDNPDRGLLCRLWFCSESSSGFLQEELGDLRQIAINLGTAPVAYALS